MQIKRFIFVIGFSLSAWGLEARLPDIDAKGVQRKLNEIMEVHASYKNYDQELVKRALNNYVELLDASKTYFIKSDIEYWTEPNDEVLEAVLTGYKHADYEAFAAIHDTMVRAIQRRRDIEAAIKDEDLPTKVDRKEFKDLEWVESEEALKDRIRKVKALQKEVADKLSEELRDKAAQRIAKYRKKYEEEVLNSKPDEKRRYIYSNVLKATASAFDSHTSYFTPDEAKQFLIGVQQRLFGIGAQLRDDINGLTVVKIVEGGPAERGGKLKNKDRIIAVDGEPIVGMDISDAVEMIRGKEGTIVNLTVIRKGETPTEGEERAPEKKLEVTIERGEVVVKEARYETSVEPFADGVIAYLRLHTFYQDPEDSSASDLHKELERLKKEYRVKGVVLDLRSNSGGMLSQAVAVAGLFITKGVVVSIKDETDKVQHLRDIDGKVTWDGPLVVMVNRASASASEIVAQALQDYGRAIIVGDEYSYGKGSFQTFTLNGSQEAAVNPEGEYKVTRGRYYTVSGKTPQKVGVAADIVIPSALAKLDLGEQHLKYPLEPDTIDPNFDDKLLDIPLMQRGRVSQLYRFDLQQRLDTYKRHLARLSENSKLRIENNKNFQAFLEEIDKEDDEDGDVNEKFGQNDLQLTEAYNVLKDLIVLMN